jgi:hypothetical protein
MKILHLYWKDTKLQHDDALQSLDLKSNSRVGENEA